MRHRVHKAELAATLVLALAPAALWISGCGKAIPFDAGDATKRDAVDTSSTIGAITQVTMVATAQDLGATWASSDYLFTGTDWGLGNNPVLDDEVGMRFVYTYPPNNFKLTRAQLLLDLSRDTSDTEAIMLCETAGNNGVFTGKTANLQGTSTRVQFDYTSNGPTLPAGDRNAFFNQWQVDHYKAFTRNTSDFNVLNLLSKLVGGTGAPLVPVVNMVDSGDLTVIIGDDTTVFQGYLLLTGYTIAKESLSCSNSASRTFENVYLHHDGTSTGSSFFTGTVKDPNTSCAWSNAGNYADGAATCANAYSGTFQSDEFYFDAPLPNVGATNITIATGVLTIDAYRQATGKSAIIINGVGVGETGFLTDPDTMPPTAAVESWISDPTTVGKWETFLAGIPADGARHDGKALDLVDLLGAAQLKSLLAQGKLNISLAGALAKTRSQRATSARVPGTQAGGPELTLQGTYFNKICSVPDDPTSPLSGTLPDYPPASSDSTPPVISSVQTLDVADTTGKVLWLTDEWADSSVEYSTGVDLNTNTLIAPTTVTLPAGAQEENDIVHEVALSGLSKYTIYFFKVHSTDYWGNTSDSAIQIFRTKR